MYNKRCPEYFDVLNKKYKFKGNRNKIKSRYGMHLLLNL